MVKAFYGQTVLSITFHSIILSKSLGCICICILINLAQRSPIVVAFVVKGDEDHVHVGHSPTMYPANLTSVSPFDNLVVVLLGNDVNSSTPLALLASSFARLAAVDSSRRSPTGFGSNIRLSTCSAGTYCFRSGLIRLFPVKSQADTRFFRRCSESGLTHHLIFGNTNCPTRATALTQNTY